MEIISNLDIDAQNMPNRIERVYKCKYCDYHHHEQITSWELLIQRLVHQHVMDDWKNTKEKLAISKSGTEETQYSLWDKPVVLGVLRIFKNNDIRIHWPIRTIYQGDEKREAEEIGKFDKKRDQVVKEYSPKEAEGAAEEE